MMKVVGISIRSTKSTLHEESNVSQFVSGAMMLSIFTLLPTVATIPTLRVSYD